MTTAIFSDLDGTLIYSARHLGEELDLTIVEQLDGNPQAWMTSRAAADLRDLRDLVPFIPVTTRVESQYRRVKLPGGEAEYAILGNGSRILIGGVEDPDWTARVEDSSWAVGRPQVMADTLERILAGEEWAKEVRIYDNIVCVAAHRGFKVPELYAALIDQLASDNGCSAYPQGRKTHIIPTHITKEAAAAEVATRLRATQSIAAGDHHLDIGLMRWADHAIQPAHGVSAPGIRETSKSGVLAGEQIVEVFHEFTVR